MGNQTLTNNTAADSHNKHTHSTVTACDDATVTYIQQRHQLARHAPSRYGKQQGARRRRDLSRLMPAAATVTTTSAHATTTATSPPCGHEMDD